MAVADAGGYCGRLWRAAEVDGAMAGAATDAADDAGGQLMRRRLVRRLRRQPMRMDDAAGG